MDAHYRVQLRAMIRPIAPALLINRPIAVGDATRLSRLCRAGPTAGLFLTTSSSDNTLPPSLADYHQRAPSQRWRDHFVRAGIYLKLSLHWSFASVYAVTAGRFAHFAPQSRRPICGRQQSTSIRPPWKWRQYRRFDAPACRARPGTLPITRHAVRSKVSATGGTFSVPSISKYRWARFHEVDKRRASSRHTLDGNQSDAPAAGKVRDWC